MQPDDPVVLKRLKILYWTPLLTGLKRPYMLCQTNYLNFTQILLLYFISFRFFHTSNLFLIYSRNLLCTLLVFWLFSKQLENSKRIVGVSPTTVHLTGIVEQTTTQNLNYLYFFVLYSMYSNKYFPSFDTICQVYSIIHFVSRKLNCLLLYRTPICNV